MQAFEDPIDSSGLRLHSCHKPLVVLAAIGWLRVDGQSVFTIKADKDQLMNARIHQLNDIYSLLDELDQFVGDGKGREQKVSE